MPIENVEIAEVLESIPFTMSHTSMLQQTFVNIPILNMLLRQSFNFFLEGSSSPYSECWYRRGKLYILLLHHIKCILMYLIFVNTTFLEFEFCQVGLSQMPDYTTLSQLDILSVIPTVSLSNVFVLLYPSYFSIER